MKILVTGDRNWTDEERIKNVLKCFPQDSTIIHGDARGADRIAGSVAFDLGLNIEIYPAKWDKYGKAAGAIRNREMYDSSKPELVIAFHNDLKNSKGTKDMVKYASKMGTYVLLVTDTSYFKDDELTEKLNLANYRNHLKNKVTHTL